MKLSQLAATCFLLAVGACSSAQAASSEPNVPDGATQAHLIAASTSPVNAVIDGRMWQCTGSDCWAQASDSAESQTPLRECRRAARVLGPFDVYRTSSHSLDNSELQACSPSANKR